MAKLEMGKLRLPERDILSRQSYESLREAILARTLPAGSKLVVRDLVEQLGLSPTPINQALAALEHDGLVESKPHRGYYVIELKPKDIVDIYTLREALEGLALRLAVELRSSELAPALRELHLQQEACWERNDVGGYGDLDLAFHRTVWRMSENKRLLQMSEMLMGQVRLLISTSAAVEGRMQASIAEHGRIVALVASGEAKGAEIVMREHVRNAGTALLGYLGTDLVLPGSERRTATPS